MKLNHKAMQISMAFLFYRDIRQCIAVMIQFAAGQLTFLCVSNAVFSSLFSFVQRFISSRENTDLGVVF